MTVNRFAAIALISADSSCSSDSSGPSLTEAPQCPAACCELSEQAIGQALLRQACKALHENRIDDARRLAAAASRLRARFATATSPDSS
jgi:hypothetical protein